MRSPLQVIANQPQVGRRWRRPQHTWNVRYLPWQMQPVFSAPVLPGETMKNAMFQARIVSDPVKNRLAGWWHEFYMYYVPLLAMSDEDSYQEAIKAMVLDPQFSAIDAGLTSNSADVDTGFNGRNQINWTRRALDAVVAADFRNENELPLTFEINGLPAVSINSRNWTDSVLAESEMQAFDVDVDDGSDGVLQASEIEQALAQYEILKMHGLVDMSYEDYLRTFGIRGRAVQEHKGPQVELLRYKRDFTYPANTVDANGNVSSALSWSMADRADKDRFFRHPGVIIGISVARPKVYMSGINGQAVHSLLALADWLPAVLRDDPLSSLKGFADGQGPLNVQVDDGDSGGQGYYVDLRDLWLYGDQFVNSGTAPTVALPTATLQRRFASLQDAYSVFMASSEGAVTKSALNHVEEDGIVNFGFLGAETDHTAQRTQFVPPEPEGD